MGKPERSRGQARPSLPLLESLEATLPSWASPCANYKLCIVFRVPSFSLFRLFVTEFRSELDDRANRVRSRGYTDPGSNEQLPFVSEHAKRPSRIMSRRITVVLVVTPVPDPVVTRQLNFFRLTETHV